MIFSQNATHVSETEAEQLLSLRENQLQQDEKNRVAQLKAREATLEIRSKVNSLLKTFSNEKRAFERKLKEYDITNEHLEPRLAPEVNASGELDCDLVQARKEREIDLEVPPEHTKIYWNQDNNAKEHKHGASSNSPRARRWVSEHEKFAETTKMTQEMIREQKEEEEKMLTPWKKYEFKTTRHASETRRIAKMAKLLSTETAIASTPETPKHSVKYEQTSSLFKSPSSSAASSSSAAATTSPSPAAFASPAASTSFAVLNAEERKKKIEEMAAKLQLSAQKKTSTTTTAEIKPVTATSTAAVTTPKKKEPVIDYDL